MTYGNGDNDVTAWYNLGEPSSILGNRWGRSTYKRSITWASAPNFARFLELSGQAEDAKLMSL